MFFKLFERRLGLSPYSRLDQDGPVEGQIEKNVISHNPSFREAQYCYLLISAILVAAAGVAGYYLGILKGHGPCDEGRPYGIAVQVPIGTTSEIFQYNSSFAAPPPRGGGSEPVWDAMIPNGLGYIKDTTIASDTSVISAFHQLHCLYTIRRAFYSTKSEGILEDFDLGKERKQHAAHCFDYIRQGILCSADSTVEPAVDSINGFLGAGFPRQCRNFGELKIWAERHRAFNAHGFLAEMEPE